jgi:Flp pilus assembly protein TadG
MRAGTSKSNGSRKLLDWCRGVRSTRLKFSPDRSECGAALVEFTILMPVFFLIVFGIMEFGMILYLQNNMLNAAREAARSIAVQGLSPTAALQSACNNFLRTSGQHFVITTTDFCPTDQDVSVKVTADAAAASIVNYLGSFTGRSLISEVRMRKELACSGAAVVTAPNNCP